MAHYSVTESQVKIDKQVETKLNKDKKVSAFIGDVPVVVKKRGKEIKLTNDLNKPNIFNGSYSCEFEVPNADWSIKLYNLLNKLYMGWIDVYIGTDEVPDKYFAIDTYSSDCFDWIEQKRKQWEEEHSPHEPFVYDFNGDIDLELSANGPSITHPGEETVGYSQWVEDNRLNGALTYWSEVVGYDETQSSRPVAYGGVKEYVVDENTIYVGNIPEEGSPVHSIYLYVDGVIEYLKHNASKKLGTFTPISVIENYTEKYRIVSELLNYVTPTQYEGFYVSQGNIDEGYYGCTATMCINTNDYPVYAEEANLEFPARSILVGNFANGTFVEIDKDPTSEDADILSALKGVGFGDIYDSDEENGALAWSEGSHCYFISYYDDGGQWFTVGGHVEVNGEKLSYFPIISRGLFDTFGEEVKLKYMIELNNPNRTEEDIENEKQYAVAHGYTYEEFVKQQECVVKEILELFSEKLKFVEYTNEVEYMSNQDARFYCQRYGRDAGRE